MWFAFYVQLLVVECLVSGVVVPRGPNAPGGFLPVLRLVMVPVELLFEG